MLKKKIYQSLTLTMAFLILLSSVGYGFVERQCTMSGKSMKYISERFLDAQSASTADSCCAKTKLQTSSKSYFTKTECCKVEHKFHRAEVMFSSSNSLVKSLLLGTNGLFWANKAYVFLRSEWDLPNNGKANRIISFSSLYHGKTMLFFLQSFII